EVRLDGLDDGDPVEVSATAEGSASVTRSARTLGRSGEALLLHMQLNDECVPASAERDVSCPGQTCIAGICEEAYISPSDLEPYRADWATPPTDACAPPSSARPSVTLVGN